MANANIFKCIDHFIEKSDTEDSKKVMNVLGFQK